MKIDTLPVRKEQFSVPVEATEPNLKLRMLSPTTDDPIAIYYFESGWNYGYPTYHVIVEYGDFEQTDYFFFSADEFKKVFNVDPTSGKDLEKWVQLEIPFTEINENLPF